MCGVCGAEIMLGDELVCVECGKTLCGGCVAVYSSSMCRQHGRGFTFLCSDCKH